MRIEIFDNMSACSEQAVEFMLPQVNAQRREQALRYKHTLGRFCCLKSWLMLRQMIGEPDTFCYNEHGKPYLANGPQFSISHCKQGIIVAVAEHPIGVDIEAIRTADEGLVQRTMNAAEQQQISNAQDADRAFIELWTQKEAVVKAQGVGIASFEQLAHVLEQHEWEVRTEQKEKYIYSIAYGKLHCFSAEIPAADL